jgi:hypothetical protein
MLCTGKFIALLSKYSDFIDDWHVTSNTVHLFCDHIYREKLLQVCEELVEFITKNIRQDGRTAYKLNCHISYQQEIEHFIIKNDMIEGF